QEADGRRSSGQRAQEIDPAHGSPASICGTPQRNGRGKPEDQREQGESANWEIDIKDPVPACVVGNPAADGRTNDKCQGKYTDKNPLPAATFCRWEYVTNQREGERLH